MPNIKVIGEKLKDALGLQYYPIGLYYSDEYPKNAINTDKKFNGCIVHFSKALQLFKFHAW
jgi:hypothetical protein